MNINELYGEDLGNHEERICVICGRGKVGNDKEGFEESTPRELHNMMFNPTDIVIGKPLLKGSNMIVQAFDMEPHPAIIICSTE